MQERACSRRCSDEKLEGPAFIPAALVIVIVNVHRRNAARSKLAPTRQPAP
jgi:hypothetical protein